MSCHVMLFYYNSSKFIFENRKVKGVHLFRAIAFWAFLKDASSKCIKIHTYTSVDLVIKGVNNIRKTKNCRLSKKKS